MQNVFATSDRHFDHYNILKYENRPFKDRYDMTDQLIKNWNEVVGDNDIVFDLGDVFFCKTDRMVEISQQLNGRKILIRGNHDKDISNTKFRRLGFDVYNYYFYEGMLLSHKPFDYTAVKNAVDSGYMLGNVCGHLHSDGANLPAEYYQCVSVELTDYKPINMRIVMANFFRNSLSKQGGL